MTFSTGSRRTIDACLGSRCTALAVALAAVWAISACAAGGGSAASAPVPLLEAIMPSRGQAAPPADAKPLASTKPGPSTKLSAATKPSAATKRTAAGKSPASAMRSGSTTTPAPRRPATARPAPGKPGSTRAPKPARVDSAALEFAVTARLAHEPLARAIARRTRNPAMAERAAWAVTREAGRTRVSPSLLAAVLLIENRQLDSTAVSSQGAIGMMQVMPMHAGSYGCGSDDLTNVDANICHGARILHLYMVRSRSVTVALRRYNGCVRGANTPRCSRYPVRVLQTAARLRRDILASATEADRHVRM